MNTLFKGSAFTDEW